MADQGYGFDDGADDLGGYEFDFVDDEQEIDADVEGVASAGDLEAWARSVVRAELSPVSRQVTEDLVLADQQASEEEQQARREAEADELEAEFPDLQSERPGDVADLLQDALIAVAQHEAAALGDPDLAREPRFVRSVLLANRDELQDFLAASQSEAEGDRIVAASPRRQAEQARARWQAEQDAEATSELDGAIERRRASQFRLNG